MPDERLEKPEPGRDHPQPPPAGLSELAEDHGEEEGGLGAVQIHNHVIATIARLAALKVPGVAGLSSSFADGLTGLFGKKSEDRGIRVVHDDNDLILHLHVVLHLGVRIPQVSWQIQHEVREAVENMTGKHVRAVNVTVQSLQFPSAQKKGVEEGSEP